MAVYRVMPPHPAYGSAVGQLVGELRGTSRQATELRLSGYGSGYAKVGVLASVLARAKQDRALDIALALCLGSLLPEIASVAARTYKLQDGSTLALPNSFMRPDPRFCLVKNACVPGFGSPPPTELITLLDMAGPILQAACIAVGSSLARCQTYAKIGAPSSTFASVYRQLRDSASGIVTIDVVEAVAKLTHDDRRAKKG